MNTKKMFITLGLALTLLTILPFARADEWNQASRLSFNQSVQIPGHVLPAGTYWFVLADSGSDRNIVQIFNSDRTTLYATVLAISAARLEPTDRTAITFAQTRFDAGERDRDLVLSGVQFRPGILVLQVGKSSPRAG